MVEGGQRVIACFDNALSIEAVSVWETEKRSLETEFFFAAYVMRIFF